MSSPSFNEKTTAGFEGGGCNGLDSKLYHFILLDSGQLEAEVLGSNNQFISCHVLGCVDAMLVFIHAVGLLKLAVLVPVHACTQQIILVFVCGMWYKINPNGEQGTFVTQLLRKHRTLVYRC